MYHSKHQNGYRISHKTPKRKFRTWKSKKKWLYGLTLISLTVSSLLPLGNLAFIPKTENAHAATSSSGTLVPGNTSYDTGGHTYSGTEFAQASNYLTYGTASIASPWINLVTNTTSSVGLGIFNGSVSSISASSGFTLKATIRADASSGILGSLGKDFVNTGDALGVILSGASKTQLATNAQSANASNSGLGIRGLPNTVFLGRDLYSNLISDNGASTTGVDGTNGTNGWTAGGGNVIAIRSTDSSGALASANYPTGTTTGTTTGQAWMQAADDSYTLGVDTGSPATVTEPVTVTWTPDATNSAPAGFTSGTLKYNLVAQTTSNGALIGASAVNGGTAGYTITTHMNLQNSLSIGFVGATGGNAGALSVSLSSATLTGQKGTQIVPVNYLNKVTGQSIPGMAASGITANVNDTIGATLTAPSSTNPDNNTYTYVVPAAPTGYQANSATTTTVLAANPASTTNTSATIVSNFIVGTTNPNALNVSYTPNQQTVSFNWAKASGTTLATLPTNLAYGVAGTGVTTDTSVVTDNPFSNTTLLSNYATALTNAVPAGYNITKISNGTTTVSGTTTAATLAAFTAANPTVSATSTNNNYTVTLTANPANIAGSFTFVDGTPGFTNTAGIAGPTGNLTLNGTGTTATVTANVGDVITIARGTSLSTTAGANVLTSSVTINSTTNTSPLTFTAPSGYYIVGYSYAGQLPQAFTTFNSGGATFTATSQSNNTIQFYLAPYSGAHYKSDGTLDLTASTSTYTDSIWKMSNAAGTTATNGVIATNAAQPKVMLETTTATGGTATLGVKSGSKTYDMYTGAGLTTSAPTGNTVNAPTQFIASQGQAYSNMQGVSGTNKFPTTNATLAIPGYKIVSVRHSNNTGDISQTTGITTSGMTATTNFSSMEAALAGNNAYYNFPPNVNNFTTNTTTNAAIDQFVVLYQPIPATVNVNNLTYTVGNMPSTNPSISALLTAALQLSSTNSDGSAAAATNMTISNLTNVGTGANLQASQLSSQPAGLYQVTYQYTDPINGTQTTALAYVNLINGTTTNVPLIGSASLTNTLNLGLNGSLTPISESVTNISYTDYEGNSKTVDITANDIELDNQGNVTIAQGKLHQGIYTISVTYSYAGGGTATVSDTINVAEPFSLPFTGGEGIAGVVSLAALTGMGGVFLRKRKKSEEETLLKVDNSVALRKTERNKSKTFQQNRRTRPYQKLFHTKNRAHLAQLQRKGKSC
ncbi:beta strand repeat-containing protein [Lactococcus lactis]|uniref:beta strand repeat-containing protein n=1 Tax=Lactococcus lactis TaxID=1358 RepID=UPI00049499D2|nr:hypothetical protein [Lactococcus lactis]MBU5242498.1 hypothetical protein [Lactococcus lactis]MDT2856978.1 hypothetical protein [Lactococcus lactis]